MSFDPSAPGLSGQAFGLPHSPDEAQVVLVPVPFEATTSYGGGTAEGPARDPRRPAAQVDLFDVETGRPYERGIAMLPRARGVARLERRGEARAPSRSSRPAASRPSGAERRLRRGSTPSASR